MSAHAFGNTTELPASLTEAVYLLLKHVFELGYRRVEWSCPATDAASRDTALRLGFAFEGLHRQSYVTKDGRNGDDYYFGIMDLDWAALAKAYERWLSGENMEENGPRRRLEE